MASRLLALAAALLLAGAGVASAPLSSGVLPLRRAASPPDWLRRRRLADGVAPLFGSVRDNGVFTVALRIGSPPSLFDVIVDTGSTLAYVPCADCGSSCGVHEARGRVVWVTRMCN